MEFNFEKLKKSMKSAAKKTKETSEVVVEAAKLKYKLVEIKSDIDDNYMMIGKLICDADSIDDEAEKINELKADIKALIEEKEDMQNKYNEIVNKKECPKCGARMEKDFEFCPRCGNNFED